MLLNMNVNGKDTEITINGCETLLEVLRNNLRLHAAKLGCGNGECGACTVLVDNEPVNACIYLAARANHKHVLTLEGVGTPGKLHLIQQNFIKYGALQCGFCGSGMILSALALLHQTPEPTEQEIKEGISGNLCRCSGYVHIIEAIKQTALDLKEEGQGIWPDSM